jgi:type IV secretory pathway TrbD component
MSKTQKDIRDIVLCVGGFGIVIGWTCGSFGAGIVGAVIWFLFMMICKMSVDHDKKVRQTYAERNAERARLYDVMVSNGIKVEYGDKPWTKGCTIDLETGAMIEPGV